MLPEGGFIALALLFLNEFLRNVCKSTALTRFGFNVRENLLLPLDIEYGDLCMISKV